MPLLNLFDLLVLALATLYLAQVLTGTEGPGKVFEKLREGTRATLGGLLDCIWCTAVWMALALMVVYLWVPMEIGKYVVYVFAIPGAALALRSFTGVHHG